jgi:uncharacterized protein (DUF1684 family)
VTSDYEKSILEWREEKERTLRGEESWLSLAGLFWLVEGENQVGSRPDCLVRLPESAASGVAGAFMVRGDQVTFRAASGAGASQDGVPLDEADLLPDTSGSPTKITLGVYTLMLIRRGARHAIRIWDRSSPRRQSFPPRQWFPIDPRYRVTADFHRYEKPRPLLVPDVSGGVQEMESPGEVTFEGLSQPARLVASDEEEGALFLIFADETSGVSSYPAGRYLYSGKPVEGGVEIDFNRAYNPPCAFTPFATCPLPLPENRLPFPIEAGERYAAEGIPR